MDQNMLTQVRKTVRHAEGFMQQWMSQIVPAPPVQQICFAMTWSHSHYTRMHKHTRVVDTPHKVVKKLHSPSTRSSLTPAGKSFAALRQPDSCAEIVCTSIQTVCSLLAYISHEANHNVEKHRNRQSQWFAFCKHGGLCTETSLCD